MNFNKIAAILLAGTLDLSLNSGCKKFEAPIAKIPLKMVWFY